MTDSGSGRHGISIHPLPSLFCLLIVSYQAFTSSFPVVCAWIALLVMVRFFFRLPLKGLFSGIVSFLKLGVAFIPFSLLRIDATFAFSLSLENLPVLGMTMMRMFEAWLAQDLFFSACKIDDLRHFFDSILKFFKPIRASGLHLAIAISFISRIVRIWNETERGYILRAGKGNAVERITTVAGTVTRKLLVCAKDTSESLRILCPRYEPQTWIDPLGNKDYAAMTFFLAAAVSSFF